MIEGTIPAEIERVLLDEETIASRVQDLAVIYVMVGEFDSALDQIEYLLSVPSWLSVPMLRLDPRWDPLRDSHAAGTQNPYIERIGKEFECQTCGHENEELKKCGQCKAVYYCSLECQKKDWPNHNQVCKKK